MNTLGSGASGALENAERLVEVCSGLTGVAVVEVGPAESFQGARFLERRLIRPGPSRGHDTRC